MSKYRIERGGREYLVDGQEALIRLVRSGCIDRRDRVREHGGVWTVAEEYPSLREAFDEDPWSVWDEIEDVDPDALWSSLARPVSPTPRPDEAEEALDDAPVLLDPSALSPLEPEALPELALTPLDEVADVERPDDAGAAGPGAGPRDAPERSPGGEVSATDSARGNVLRFPNERRTSASTRPPASDDGAPGEVMALPQLAESYQLSRDVKILRSPPTAPKAVDPLRLGVLLTPIGLVFAIVLWWVPNQASWTSEPPLPGGVTSVPPEYDADTRPTPEPTPEPEPEPEPAAVTESERLADTLEQIRVEMRRGVSDVREEGDLADALLLELSQLQLFGEIEAQVLTWKGPGSTRFPTLADISITVGTSTAERERDVAAVGLVVGKYVKTYGFDVRELETRFRIEDTGKTVIFPMKASAAGELYEGELSLLEFFSGG